MKPVMSLKPHIINALFPTVLKSFLISVLLTGAVLLLFVILNLVGVNTKLMEYITGSIILLLIIFGLLPLIWELNRLRCTSYNFYDTYVDKEYTFLGIKKTSVPYSHISNIVVDISLWDRICHAGDITLSTSDDNQPDLKLQYLSPINEIERRIHILMSKKNN